jgi:hypothetical protein
MLGWQRGCGWPHNSRYDNDVQTDLKHYGEWLDAAKVAHSLGRQAIAAIN